MQFNETRLDEMQLAAVHSDAQHIQIIGYPGSGKTLVLAQRIARLISENTAPESIFALTFTNSAQATLRKSIEHAIDAPNAQELAGRVRVHTFHGFSRDLISGYGYKVGVADEDVMFDFLDPVNLTYNPLSGVQTRRFSGDAAKLSTIERESLQRFLKRYHTFDFDEALRLATKIIEFGVVDVKHLFVDEFQDCTSLQWRLLHAVMRGNSHACIVACGDPNQEIFSFQEGHLHNAFAKMRREFPSTQEIELLYNYRSTPEIVETTQAILNSHADSLRPRGRIVSSLPHDAEPEMLECNFPDEEATAVGQTIQELVAEKFQYRDVAVLVRTQKDVQNFTSLLATRFDIPTHSFISIRGLGLKKLPNLALTLLKWAHDPKDVYLLQLMYNRFCRYLRPSALSYLNEQMDSSSLPLSEELLDPKLKLRAPSFFASWLPSLRNELLNVESLSMLLEILNRAIAQWEDRSETRVSVSETDRKDWADFLRYMDDALGGVELGQSSNALEIILEHLFFPGKSETEMDNKVTVSTIHSAKSCEWPAVLLPSISQMRVFDKPVQAHRLQYVAASRAKSRLYFFNSGVIHEGSRNSYVPVRVPPPFLSMVRTTRLYPLLLKPLKLI